MYLYFDKKGALKEIVNDEALRQGNYNVNTLYVYVENVSSTEETIYDLIQATYLLPSELIVGPTGHQEQVVATLPYNPKRDLRFFKYGINYRFFKITMTDDLAGHNPLDEAGTVHCDLVAIIAGENGSALSLGGLNFEVEENAVYNQKNIASEQYMSLANYNYLLFRISEQGAPAGFGQVTAEITSDGGAPAVDVTTDGPNTSKEFHFDFKNIKGEKGDQGVPGLNLRSNGLFALAVEGEDLVAYYPDSGTDPRDYLSIDSNGNLIYTYEE